MIKVIENIDLEKNYLEFKLEGISRYALFSNNQLIEEYGYQCKSLVDIDQIDTMDYEEDYTEEELDEYFDYSANNQDKFDEDYDYLYEYSDDELGENEIIENKDHVLHLFYNTPYICFVDGVPYELYAIKDQNRALVLFSRFNFVPFVGEFSDNIYVEEINSSKVLSLFDTAEINALKDYYDYILSPPEMESYNILHDCYVLEFEGKKIEDGNAYFKHWDETIDEYDTFLLTFFVSKLDNCIYNIHLSLELSQRGVLLPYIDSLGIAYSQNNYSLEDFKQMLEQENDNKPKVLKLTKDDK